jgi:pantothenate kinase
MTQKDSLSDALHERLDKLGEQLERAWDEAEQAYLELAEQQQARREEFRAMALEYQRCWQELSEKAIRYCAGRAGSAAATEKTMNRERAILKQQ